MTGLAILALLAFPYWLWRQRHKPWRRTPQEMGQHNRSQGAHLRHRWLIGGQVWRRK